MFVEHLMPFSLSSVNISLGPGQNFCLLGSFPKNLGSIVNVLNPYWKDHQPRSNLEYTSVLPESRHQCVTRQVESGFDGIVYKQREWLRHPRTHSLCECKT